jgi:hypothetical protein
MEAEVMQTVLLEVLGELKEVKQQQAETAKALSEIKGNMASFEQKLAAVKIVPPAIDTEPITAVIKTGFDNVITTIEAQPKSVIKQFRVLLFPEYNTEEYYRIVFGRLLFWMLMFLTVTYLYLLAKDFIERY